MSDAGGSGTGETAEIPARLLLLPDVLHRRDRRYRKPEEDRIRNTTRRTRRRATWHDRGQSPKRDWRTGNRHAKLVGRRQSRRVRVGIVIVRVGPVTCNNRTSRMRGVLFRKKGKNIKERQRRDRRSLTIKYVLHGYGKWSNLSLSGESLDSRFHWIFPMGGISSSGQERRI